MWAALDSCRHAVRGLVGDVHVGPGAVPPPAAEVGKFESANVVAGGHEDGGATPYATATNAGTVLRQEADDLNDHHSATDEELMAMAVPEPTTKPSGFYGLWLDKRLTYNDKSALNELGAIYTWVVITTISTDGSINGLTLDPRLVNSKCLGAKSANNSTLPLSLVRSKSEVQKAAVQHPKPLTDAQRQRMEARRLVALHRLKVKKEQSLR
ncbi:hypothetical protein THAOC_03738 [Thalassiosira oceanica]|uniref:Uncharacterized protein n=1 Tax=Thalassiosira oceanica TaxID=159749 RepID=K0TAP1_THAOC|nr:hypothetical protein THAOC_03738 [Thalassiosira oceanica]|eukprot:EJK74575.1 hypothetical protein THAOC_03738 [Thalassiosira oceanica]